MSEELSEAAALMLGVTVAETPPDDPAPEMATLSDDPATETEQPEAVEVPKGDPDLSSLLEKAELDPKDFYKLIVPGTESTFGQAKDALQGLEERAAHDAQRESEFRDRENGLLVKTRETLELYDLLPAQVKTPEVSHEFERIKTNEIRRENQLTLAAMPEWRDPVKSTADREGIAELMGEYGFSSSEIGQLYGSRELKAWRDYMVLKKMVSGIPEKQVKKPAKQLRTTKRQPVSTQRIEGATEGGALLLKSLYKG